MENKNENFMEMWKTKNYNQDANVAGIHKTPRELLQWNLVTLEQE